MHLAANGNMFDSLQSLCRESFDTLFQLFQNFDGILDIFLDRAVVGMRNIGLGWLTNGFDNSFGSDVDK